MDLGKTISKRRKQRGMSSGELAKKLDISPAYLSLLEHNKKSPSQKMLKGICDTLQVPLIVMIWGATEISDINPDLYEAYKAIDTPITNLLESLVKK